MTGGQYLLNQIIEKRDLILKLRDELQELESDLSGMEIKYPDSSYAAIEFADAMDGQVQLYIEEDEGYFYNVMLSLYEVEKLL